MCSSLNTPLLSDVRPQVTYKRKFWGAQTSAGDKKRSKRKKSVNKVSATFECRSSTHFKAGAPPARPAIAPSPPSRSETSVACLLSQGDMWINKQVSGQEESRQSGD